MTREEAVGALYLATLCLDQQSEPASFIDKWVLPGWLEPKGSELNLIDPILVGEPIATLAYTLMSTAIAAVPTL